MKRLFSSHTLKKWQCFTIALTFPLFLSHTSKPSKQLAHWTVAHSLNRHLATTSVACVCQQRCLYACISIQWDTKKRVFFNELLRLQLFTTSTSVSINVVTLFKPLRMRLVYFENVEKKLFQLVQYSHWIYECIVYGDTCKSCFRLCMYPQLYIHAE